MATVREGGRTALLVVDVQVGVMNTAWDAPRVIANVALAVDRARQQALPVLWVQHANHELPTDSPAWQWVPGLQPAEGEPLIAKAYNSAFEHTTLEATLARLGISHLVLAGAASNWCIRATAYAALERGYDLTLVADAHGTEPVTLADGSRIEAAGIVHELNVAMQWLEYPGRRNRAVNAADLSFTEAAAG